jgi:hypothetical protein
LNMTLNTNSWDFIYTAYLESADKALRKDVLFKDVTIKYVDKFELKIVSTTVNFVSIDETKITLKVTCNGTYKTYNSGTWSIESNFTGMELKFLNLLLDYFNKVDVEYVTSDFECDVTGMPSGIEANDLVHYFHSFTSSTTNIITNPLVGGPLTKMPFHSYFSELAFFNGQTWMKPSLLRIGLQINKYDTQTPKRTYIAFCYMLSRKENNVEKAYNNNPSYVDFNAIPIGATSALVIERSIFGEYMVKAAFGKKDKDIDTKDPNDATKTIKAKTFNGSLFEGLEADGDLVKAGTYAFSNNKKIQLKSTDYNNEKDTPVSGTVEAERMLLSIEESNIKLAMGDVEYTYNSKNNPTINQEYVFDLKWDFKDPTNTKVTTKQLVASGKEKLFIVSNDFKPNITWGWILNIGVPIVKVFLLEPLLTSAAESMYGYKPSSFIRIEKMEGNTGSPDKKKKLNRVGPLARLKASVADRRRRKREKGRAKQAAADAKKNEDPNESQMAVLNNSILENNNIKVPEEKKEDANRSFKVEVTSKIQYSFNYHPSQSIENYYLNLYFAYVKDLKSLYGEVLNILKLKRKYKLKDNPEDDSFDRYIKDAEEGDIKFLEKILVVAKLYKLNSEPFIKAYQIFLSSQSSRFIKFNKSNSYDPFGIDSFSFWLNEPHCSIYFNNIDGFNLNEFKIYFELTKGVIPFNQKFKKNYTFNLYEILYHLEQTWEKCERKDAKIVEKIKKLKES